MKSKIKYLSIITILIYSSLSAQNYESDALQFSTNSLDGTARFVGVGGAMSAVGADISTFHYNPAGVAVYQTSVLSFTPSLHIHKSDAVFTSSSFQEQKSQFNISNIGGAFHFKVKKHSAIQHINLGLALNNTNNFNEKYLFNRATNESITQEWVNEANVINGSTDGTVNYDKFSFETVGAYYTYLVNFDSSSMQYTSPINKRILQKNIVERSGNKKDIVIALGASVFNKLYIGANVGVPIINYTSKSSFQETDAYNENGSFEQFKLSNAYSNKGNGYYVSVGAIYKPISILRLSAAIQSKTRIKLTERYTSDFETQFSTISYVDKSAEGTFTYTLSTPWRANAGIALVHKKLGFVSFDYEMIDRASMRIIFADDYQTTEDVLNDNIKSKYQMQHHFKVGAESKIKQWKIRGGYGIQTSPLKEKYRVGKNDFSSQQFSAGIGFLWKRISLDAAYRYTLMNTFETSYNGKDGIAKMTDDQLFLISIAVRLGKDNF